MTLSYVMTLVDDKILRINNKQENKEQETIEQWANSIAVCNMGVQ